MDYRIPRSTLPKCFGESPQFGNPPFTFPKTMEGEEASAQAPLHLNALSLSLSISLSLSLSLSICLSVCPSVCPSVRSGRVYPRSLFKGLQFGFSRPSVHCPSPDILLQLLGAMLCPATLRGAQSHSGLMTPTPKPHSPRPDLDPLSASISTWIWPNLIELN